MHLPLIQHSPPDAEKAAAVKVSEAEHIEGGTVDIVAREVFAAIPGADGPMALRNVQKLASTGLARRWPWSCGLAFLGHSSQVECPCCLSYVSDVFDIVAFASGACPSGWTEERDVSLADLASMSLQDLVLAFGKAKGRRMFDFFNYSVD